MKGLSEDRYDETFASEDAKTSAKLMGKKIFTILHSKIFLI